ncbi:putative N-acetyltransferase p20 [Madurella mycetomatis]|uniref:N-acetyltransferase p20 n=1 Tax=Madurella mycetomatis TaxID=100816 RepID=A0A175W9U9_9PEZI|nr:putative N-acetyltransferase p20 [Madurella mycetomatis]
MSTTTPGHQPQEPPVPQPILTLRKSHIRQYHDSDVPHVQRAADSPAVARYLTESFPSPYTLSDAENWIAYALTATVPNDPLNTPVAFAICNKETDIPLGGIGMKVGYAAEGWDHILEVAYWLGEAAWGKGIMTEALGGFVGWLFGRFPRLMRLEAGVFEGNDGSVKVLETVGFMLEGKRRKQGVDRLGGWCDVLEFGLLREEWVKRNAEGATGN